MARRILRTTAAVVVAAGLLAATGLLTAPVGAFGSAPPPTTEPVGVGRIDSPLDTVDGPLTAGNGINLVAANAPALPG